MKRQYRIVTDKICGFEVQYTYWWFPFWIQLGWTNTHHTISEAKKYIQYDKQTSIKNKILNIWAGFKKYKRPDIWKE